MGRYRKYTDEQLEEAVANSFSYANVLRCLGLKQAGGTQRHIKNRINKLQLDVSHFRSQGWNKGLEARNKKTADEILVLLPEGSYKTKVQQLRRALVEKGVPKICATPNCNVSDTWNDIPIELEIDHINGNFLDNRLINLQFLCPNCHYQKTWMKEYKGTWRN